MKICVCDDEKNIIEMIIGFINNISPEYIVKDFTSGNALLASSEIYDIVFLDIQMNGLNGIQTAKELKKRSPEIIIIFTSNYPEFVTDAFAVQAFQYIIKPIDRENFNKIFISAVEAYKKSHYIYSVKCGNEEFLIDVRDIIYIETYGRKLRIITTSERHEYIGRISNEFEKLKHFYFVRVQRCCIVNMAYVKNYSKSSFELKDGQIMPISKGFQLYVGETFTKFVKQFKI